MLRPMTASAKGLLTRLFKILRPLIGLLIMALILLNITLGFVNRDPWNLCVAMLLILIHVGGLVTTVATRAPVQNITVNGVPGARDAFDEAFRRHFPPTNRM